MDNHISPHFEITCLVNMDLTVILVSVAVVCMVVHLVQNLVTSRRFPGGPWGYPIVGYLPWLGPHPQITFTNLREKYGDIYSVKLGQWTAVVVNGLDNLRHVLGENTESTSSRPPFYSFQFNMKDRGPGLGFCQYNSRYLTMRKSTMDCVRRVLRKEAGDVHQTALQDAKALAACLLGLNGVPSDIYSPVSLHVGSFIYETGYGMQGTIYEDEDFMQYRKYFRDFLEFQGHDNIVNLLPWTRFFMRKKMARFHHTMSLWHRVDARAKKKHLDTFDESHLRDALDLMISKTRSMTSEVKAAVGVTDDDILNCIEELVGAGSDTLPTYMRWGFLFLALNPDAQESLYQEIVDHFGTDGVPQHDQLPKMPYTEATLTEINRLASIIPLCLPHYTTKSVKIQQYVIPENTMVIPNLHSANMDESFWDEPKKFRPERFLDSHNGLKRNLVGKVISFGIGKRSCPLEALARYVTFVFLVVLIQRCRFETVPGEHYDMRGSYGLSVWPTPHRLIITPRGSCSRQSQPL
ncbi:cytochrome P450 1A1-like [Lineus longissimus]|uniref:cytochrome P450 1A1-like n=1 Tax=Lineus longissimus TaxID=88925 RepID=UPI002B4DF04E